MTHLHICFDHTSETWNCPDELCEGFIPAGEDNCPHCHASTLGSPRRDRVWELLQDCPRLRVEIENGAGIWPVFSPTTTWLPLGADSCEHDCCTRIQVPQESILEVMKALIDFGPPFVDAKIVTCTGSRGTPATELMQLFRAGQAWMVAAKDGREFPVQRIGSEEGDGTPYEGSTVHFRENTRLRRGIIHREHQVICEK